MPHINSERILKNIPEDILLRKNNQVLPIIRETWRLPGISRQELSKILGISKVAVAKNVDRLISMNIITESAGKNEKAGRNPIALNLKNDLFHSIGINLTNNFTQLSVLDSACNEIIKLEINHPDLNAKDSSKLIIKALDDALCDKNISLSSFVGIGITIAGTLDVDKGVVLSTQTFPNDLSIPLADYFSNHYNCPAFLINNANLMAIAEHWYGKGQNMKSFLYFTMGYGLGMILNGNLYDGYQHNAGEVGFMQIQDWGEQSPDGRCGTLNMVKPAYRIIPRIKEILDRDNYSIGKKKIIFSNNDQHNWLQILSAVKANDKLCIQFISETFEVIARGIVNLAYIFNPEAIFFEPWTEKYRNVSLDIVERVMVHYGIHYTQLSTNICSAAYGADDLAKHASIIPVKKFFS